MDTITSNQTTLRCGVAADAELLAQAKEGALAGLDQDGDHVIDASSDEAAHTHAELASWVQSCLQLTQTQLELLVSAMLINGMTRERMVEAAQNLGGFQVLCDMLSAQASELSLRPGDVLALANAALRTKETASARDGEAGPPRVSHAL